MIALTDLIGRWRLVRTITHDDGLVGRAEGEAAWRETGEGAVQEESGLLHLPGVVPLKFERSYHWRGLEVSFPDGRPFHAVPADGGVAEHWCDPDRYAVRYDFSRFPDWRASWRVDGPRKGYLMVTDYTRESAEV